MGWGSWLLLGDLGQQLDLVRQQREIHELRSRLRDSSASTEPLSDQLEAVRRENDELKLYLAAVLRLLMTKGIASKEEIASMVDLIDASDGEKDRKYTGNIDSLG